VDVVETEVMSLHEGNIARFRLLPPEYEAWKPNWSWSSRRGEASAWTTAARLAEGAGTVDLRQAGKSNLSTFDGQVHRHSPALGRRPMIEGAGD